MSLPNTLNTLRKFQGREKYFYSLPALEEQGYPQIKRMPISLRIVLESLLRNCDGVRVKEQDVIQLATSSRAPKTALEIPFVVSRVLLQDFTGVPLIVDLAAMRDIVAKKGYDPALIEPEVPVDLVVDHSVQVDRAGTQDAYSFNLKLEFERNLERYQFLKWGEGAYKTFKVVAPGIGIVHQVNLEYLAKVVMEKKVNNQEVVYPDTLVGTDSHTTMINGLGVVGWGVGGIEAQAAMLGQPVTIQLPEVIGVYLTGKLREGVTGTDLTLHVTQMLRKENVVDKFVEFYGPGVGNLTVADRGTIGNMAPEYGATIGFFPVDHKTLDYLKMTGRSEEEITRVQEYLEAQHLFGVYEKDELDFTKVLELNLDAIQPSVSGPSRPQDRIDLKQIKGQFQELLKKPKAQGGYEKTDEEIRKRVHLVTNGKFSLHEHHETGGIEQIKPGSSICEVEMVTNRPYTNADANPEYTVANPGDGTLTHGSVVIAAITSCTNTSNPFVMVGAGLLAKKAVEKGLRVNGLVKTSLAPGSRVVTDYLNKTGLQDYLNKLGFQLVGYGCTTCIGNSGPLDQLIEHAIHQNDFIAASVLSGNRNFEARIHGSVKANYLMSPPLVVAFAIAGRVDIDLDKEPLGLDKEGRPVFLKEIWPSNKEIEEVIAKNITPGMFKERYSHIHRENPLWDKIQVEKDAVYAWDPKSSYIQQPPYFDTYTQELPASQQIKDLRCLAVFGDSVTTDHISPAGAIRADSPAGKYLISLGIKEEDFNSFGSRRGNHHVMMRGTFGNVRIKNKLADGKEGGYTKLYPEGQLTSIFEACEAYAKRGESLIVFAGKDYGMGSSRDWAAKGTQLLGVKAVVAQSFERIHRSNLIGMGVLPLEFMPGDSVESLGIAGDETFSIEGLENEMKPGQELGLVINGKDKKRTARVQLRIDTPIEISYYQNGGIMPYVLRQIIARKQKR